jgi:hypothetical protein
MRSPVERLVFLLFSLPFIFDCIFSRLHYSFILDRLIGRSEVIAGDSSDDSDSVIEMFAIPLLARQQVQRQQEKPSSTSTTNTSRSTSTSNTSQLASTANTSTANTSKGTTTNAAQRRSALGGFVFTSNRRSGIRSANHAAGIIGLI